MPGPSFTLSYQLARHEWTEGKDPLDILYPHEVQAAQLYHDLNSNPAHQKNQFGNVRDKRVFATAFREHFGFELTSKIRKYLMDNPAFRAYVKSLQHQTADAIIRRLEADGLTAYQDYLESRRMAKEAGDHKELRLGASDHLDRIGATKKTDTIQREVVVILKGQNFGEADLLKALPAISNEIIIEKEEVE